MSCIYKNINRVLFKKKKKNEHKNHLNTYLFLNIVKGNNHIRKVLDLLCFNFNFVECNGRSYNTTKIIWKVDIKTL